MAPATAGSTIRTTNGAALLRDAWTVAFNSRTIDPSGRRTPSGTTPHWARPLARIRHLGGCQGVLGAVLRLDGVDVLGLHGRHGSYEWFRALRVVNNPAIASTARAASEPRTLAVCPGCGHHVDIRGLHGDLRHLPIDLPDRPRIFHV